MRAAVARLLTDPEHRRAFFDAPAGDAPQFGLTIEEFAMLRRIDSRKLGITSEGFSGKRMERVASAFPLTLAALEAARPGATLRYLAQTRFPADEAEERSIFLAHLAHAEAWPDAWRRCLLDLADVEAALARRPPQGPPPRMRFRVDVTRPRRTPLADPVPLRGPLDRLASNLPLRLPEDYPEDPRACLAWKEGAALRLEPLDDARADLLARCDGRTTVTELAAGDAGVVATLDAWTRRGVLE